MGNAALYEGWASTPIVLSEIRFDRQRLIASNCAPFKDRVRPIPAIGVRTDEWPLPEVQQPASAVTGERTGALGAIRAARRSISSSGVRSGENAQHTVAHLGLNLGDGFGTDAPRFMKAHAACAIGLENAVDHNAVEVHVRIELS
jgi:hypothetical protein